MFAYEKLPKGTSKRTQNLVVLVGILLGFCFVVEGLMALYAFCGLLAPLFFSNVSIPLQPRDTVLFIVQALSGSFACLLLGYVAFFMDRLSKRALPFSRWPYAPIIITYLCVATPRHSPGFSYHLGSGWAVATLLAIPLGGIIPYLFLRTRAARKLHSR